MQDCLTKYALAVPLRTERAEDNSPQIRDKWIDIAMFAYNTSVHESTGFTPHELVFGVKPRVPSARSIEGIGGKPYRVLFQELTEGLKRVREQTRINLTKSKQRSKKYYDRKVWEIPLQVGESVWLLKEPRTGKRDDDWKGPYQEASPNLAAIDSGNRTRGEPDGERKIQ
ncbi:uncharacterized protein LOC135169150 [Diachasmimorpha longicaudata]|uniref:uncharacterized protein LOC135169150 n=1 Tax=Diachasmimorpha longicaudata TaxID=58733 RepID=UPI0030B8F550